MNIRQLKGLWVISGFDGAYAEFKAKDGQGLYRGLIDRKGEIVWNDGLRHPIMKVRTHPSVYMSIRRGENELCYFDVVKQQYIEKPDVQPLQMTKAEILVDEAPFIEGIDPFDYHKCSYKPLQVLTDNYLAFAEGMYNWGVRDLNGKVLIPAQFTHIHYGGCDTHFLVDKEEEYGVISLSGEWIIPLGKFEWLWFRGSYFLARKDGRAGIVDLKGNVLIPFEYDYLHPSYDEGLNLISAKKGGMFFFINAEQEIVDLF